MEVFDGELYAIEKASAWALLEPTPGKSNKDIWIFTDSQAAIQRLQHQKPGPGQELSTKIYINLRSLKESGFLVHIHWIPSHQDIPGNDLADEAARKGATHKDINPIADRFTSFSYVKRKIKSEAILE